MATITFKVWDQDGVLADAESVVLADKSGTYGIKRTATGAVVVAVNTAFTRMETGTYQYTFTPPQTLVSYTGWVKVVYKHRTNYYEIVYVPAAEVEQVINSPSSILATYLIDTLGAFITPGDSGSWPLYRTVMPDALGVNFEVASIHDTTPVIDAKLMDGSLVQQNGIQLRVRSKVYETGYQKLVSVIRVLATLHGVVVTMVNGNRYEIVNVSVASDAVYIGPDEKQRSHFTANLLAKFRTL
jgi:hypothetical protein